MDAKSPQEERLSKIRALALVIAGGGVWTKEQAREAADLGEIKQVLAEMDGKQALARRLEGQVITLRKKV